MRQQWQNGALSQIGQAVDMIAEETRHKQNRQYTEKVRQQAWDREDQVRAENNARQDARDRTKHKLGYLSSLSAEPGQTPESKSEIQRSMLSVITDPETDLNGMTPQKQMVPVPEEWDNLLGGYFSRMGMKEIPRDQYDAFYKDYQAYMKEQRRNSLDREKMQNARNVANIYKSGRPTEKETNMKTRREKLKQYALSASSVLESGGFPSLDKDGLETIIPVDKDTILKYIREIDRLDKKAIQGKWTEEDETAFMELTNFLDYWTGIQDANDQKGRGFTQRGGVLGKIRGMETQRLMAGQIPSDQVQLPSRERAIEMMTGETPGMQTASGLKHLTEYDPRNIGTRSDIEAGHMPPADKKIADLLSANGFAVSPENIQRFKKQNPDFN